MLITALKEKILRSNRFTLEESAALYTTSAVSDLAISLIGIYLPIYIYQISLENLIFHSNSLINGLGWISIYYLVLSIGVLCTILFFTHSIFNKLHLKSSLFTGIILRIVSLILLHFSARNYYLLIPSAAFWGARIAFYWIPYHIFFVRRTDDGGHKFGTGIGKRRFFSGIATALGPLLGGLIITNLGFNILFYLTIVLLLSSALPTVLYVKEERHKTHRIKDVWNEFLWNKKFLNTTIALAGRDTASIIVTIYWSIMLYLKLANFVELGFLNTISCILATVLFLIIGKLIDHHEKTGLHGISVVINSLIQISRVFIVSTVSFYINNIFDQINNSAYSTIFMSATYEKAQKNKVSNFMVYRLMVFHLSRIFLLGFVTLTILLTGTWQWVFIVGAIASGLTFLINY